MTIATARTHTRTGPHMGECPDCGGPLHSDPDPKRVGWLICPICGPVYMPLDGRMIRVHVGCTMEEASRCAAGLIVALENLV